MGREGGLKGRRAGGKKGSLPGEGKGIKEAYQVKE